MREGLKFRGALPGGASTDFLIEEHLDTPMDFDSVQKAGSRLGTGTIIVLDDQTCPVGMVHNLEAFFAQESCGWCTPCRDGLPWTAKILEAIEQGSGQPGDLDILGISYPFFGSGQNFLRARSGRYGTVAKCLEIFSRRFRAPYYRETVPVEIGMATIYIDNVPYEVKDGENLLNACLSLGFNIPYFCWHPALHSVGSCRLCAVKQFRDEKDTRGMLVMSCITDAADGTRISIDDPEARQFRAGVIEWLMTNHPHDCPVCDEGGECHLQDMTVMTGHTYRRYRFKKRTYRNQDLGPFLTHEMNRCIQCYRCVRFYRDYAGRDFNVFGMHNHLYSEGPKRAFSRMNSVAISSKCAPQGFSRTKRFKNTIPVNGISDSAVRLCTLRAGLQHYTRRKIWFSA